MNDIRFWSKLCNSLTSLLPMWQNLGATWHIPPPLKFFLQTIYLVVPLLHWFFLPSCNLCYPSIVIVDTLCCNDIFILLILPKTLLDALTISMQYVFWFLQGVPRFVGQGFMDVRDFLALYPIKLQVFRFFGKHFCIQPSCGFMILMQIKWLILDLFVHWAKMGLVVELVILANIYHSHGEYHDKAVTVWHHGKSSRDEDAKGCLKSRKNLVNKHTIWL